MGTALQAGAAFRYSLLWAIALGTICIAFLCEMTGRLAAVSHHTVVAAVRERFGLSFQIWPLAAQIIVDLFVLACELGGAALALQLATGHSARDLRRAGGSASRLVLPVVRHVRRDRAWRRFARSGDVVLRRGGVAASARIGARSAPACCRTCRPLRAHTMRISP